MTSPILDGEIRDGRHHMQVRVYYEDTDFSGIVYHANYLRFMERGRTNHLRLMGASQHALFEQAQAETPGFAFVVRSMQLDFFKPARMDDVLDVVTWPVAVKGASITLAQEVRRGDDVLVKAQVRVAFICDGKAQPIPKALGVLMKADLECSKSDRPKDTVVPARALLGRDDSVPTPPPCGAPSRPCRARIPWRAPSPPPGASSSAPDNPSLRDTARSRSSGWRCSSSARW